MIDPNSLLIQDNVMMMQKLMKRGPQGNRPLIWPPARLTTKTLKMMTTVEMMMPEMRMNKIMLVTLLRITGLCNEIQVSTGERVQSLMVLSDGSNGYFWDKFPQHLLRYILKY